MKRSHFWILFAVALLAGCNTNPPTITQSPQLPTPSVKFAELTFPSGFFAGVENERKMLVRVNCPSAEGKILGVKDVNKPFQFLGVKPLNNKTSTDVCNGLQATTATNNNRKAKITIETLPDSPFWRYSVRSATEAANLEQTARTPEQWEGVSQQWQTAIAFAQQVSSHDPNHATAQQKAEEWGENRRIALQKITSVHSQPTEKQPEKQSKPQKRRVRSRDPVSGSCDCPYDTDSAGRSCGARSAYSKPGGREPICFKEVEMEQ